MGKPSAEPSEKDIQGAVWELLEARGCTMYRNNVGAYEYAPGAWVRYGVGNPGGSDLIGYRPIKITADMVGTTIAQFIALEVKGVNGRVTDEQRHFVRVARESGALAGVVWVRPAQSLAGRVPASEAWELADVEAALDSGAVPASSVTRSRP